MAKDKAREYWEEVRELDKFGGQPAYIPYFWYRGLNGHADAETAYSFKFTVKEHDRELFPELKIGEVLHLVELWCGFVVEADSLSPPELNRIYTENGRAFWLAGFLIVAGKTVELAESTLTDWLNNQERKMEVWSVDENGNEHPYQFITQT